MSEEQPGLVEGDNEDGEDIVVVTVAVAVTVADVILGCWAGD